MFEKSVVDFIKAIRMRPDEEENLIAQELIAIRRELTSGASTVKIKAQALEKLLYLRMVAACEYKWAEFKVVELMAVPSFFEKNIAFTCAAQWFGPKTEVALLTTQVLKRTLISAKNHMEKASALNCISCISNEAIADSLVEDVLALVSSSEEFVAKRALLTIYKLLEKSPAHLKVVFESIRSKLDLKKNSISIVTSAISVICELAVYNPRNYISVSPTLFTILTSSSNTWLLIKVVKLFRILQCEEPRLPNKIVSHLSNLILTTSAKSLLCECLITLIHGLPFISSEKIASTSKLCSESLASLLNDRDPNLRYMGLVGIKYMAETFPKSLVDIENRLLEILLDSDPTLKSRALYIIVHTISPTNLSDIVGRLLTFVERVAVENHNSFSFCQEFGTGKDFALLLIKKILYICAKDNYKMVENIQWYFETLINLLSFPSILVLFDRSVSREFCNQLVDITIKSVDIQKLCALTIESLLIEHRFLSQIEESDNTELSDVCFALVWIIGEFYHVKPDISLNSCSTLLTTLLDSSKKLVLDFDSLPVFISSAFKIFNVAHGLVGDNIELLIPIIDAVKERLNQLNRATMLVEIQERISGFQNWLQSILDNRLGSDDCIKDLEYLNPVNEKAQRKVPIPSGLDLDAWILEPFEDIVSPGRNKLFGSWDGARSWVTETSPVTDPKSFSRQKEGDPFYLMKTFSDIEEKSSFYLEHASPDLLISRRLISSNFATSVQSKLKEEELPPGAMSSDDESEQKHLLKSESLASINLRDTIDKQVRSRKSNLPKHHRARKVLRSQDHELSFLCGDDILRCKYVIFSDEFESFLHLRISITFILPPSVPDCRLKRVVWFPDDIMFENASMYVELSSPLENVGSSGEGLLIVEKQRSSGTFERTIGLRCTRLSGDSPLRLPGRIEYQLKFSKDFQSSIARKKVLPCEMFVSVPSLIHPQRDLTTSESLQSLLVESKACPYTISETLEHMKSVSHSKFVDFICCSLHVGLIDSRGSTAVFHGRTVLGHHIAILLKSQTSSVDVKASEDHLVHACISVLRRCPQ